MTEKTLPAAASAASATPAEPHPFRLVRVAVLAVGIGVVAALTAFVVYHLIGLLYNAFFFQRFSTAFVEPPDEGLPWWIVFVPALGGLACGLLARYGCRRIIGHGIPEAMEAVWTNSSRVQPRIFFLKPFSAALAIGTGAPFGVEGPIIQGGGAMGSVVGQWVTASAEERKVMLAAGAAAGMAATFNTPLAAILVAIELLVFEFRARSFISITVAAIVAAWTRHLLIGTGPMFLMAPVASPDVFRALPFLVVLGVLVGALALVFKNGYFAAERLIHRIPVNDVVLPALGGLAFGVMGFVVPRAFGVGYEVIQEILNDRIAVGLVLAVMVFKLVGVTITLGSKTSGGFLAPAFVAGAAVGSLFAHGANAAVPGLELPVPLFALASMGVLFGVLCNATLGFTLFALEVTGQFGALLPVFLVASVADVFVKKTMAWDLMTAELADRGVDVHQEFEVDLLKRFKVGEVMDAPPPHAEPSTTVAALVERVAPGVAEAAAGPAGGQDAFPILGPGGRLEGIITYGDLVRAMARGRWEQGALQAGTHGLLVAHPDERLWDAMVRMADHRVEQLAVVTRGEPDRLVGWLDAQDALATALARVRREGVLEAGWLRRWLSLRRRGAPPEPPGSHREACWSRSTNLLVDGSAAGGRSCPRAPPSPRRRTMDVAFTDRELDIMGVLWEHGPSTVAEVRERLDDPLAYNTVLTMLRILEEKGHVRHEEEGRAHRYFPVVDREAAGAGAVRRVVRRLFRDSPSLLLTQLVRERGVPDDELRRMRALIDELLGEEGP